MKMNDNSKLMAQGVGCIAIGAPTAVVCNALIGGTTSVALKAALVVPWAAGIATMGVGMLAFGTGFYRGLKEGFKQK